MKETREKKRVVFGLNDFLVGGMQHQFLRQARLFDHDRFEIILVTLFQFPGREELYAQLPEQVRAYRVSFRSWRDIRAWHRAWKLMRQLRPDLVVSSLFLANTVFRILKPFVGYVSVAREHNTYTDKPRIHCWIDRVLAHLSWRIVAVSRTVASYTAAQEGIPAGRFEVIHNGIDLEQVQRTLASLPDKGTIRGRLGLAPDDFVILNVARLAAQKNHTLLIAGFKRFAEGHPSRKLLLVGEGGQRAALEELVRAEGLRGQVRFFGMRDDIWNFYKAADVFASTSSMEGFSNAYLEALAAGLPIVSTLTAGTDEFLEDGYNGYSIREASAASVAAALSEAATADLEKLGVHCRETAERFSLRQTVDRYEALFTEALTPS